MSFSCVRNVDQNVFGFQPLSTADHVQITFRNPGSNKFYIINIRKDFTEINMQGIIALASQVKIDCYFGGSGYWETNPAKLQHLSVEQKLLQTKMLTLQEQWVTMTEARRLAEKFGLNKILSTILSPDRPISTLRHPFLTCNDCGLPVARNKTATWMHRCGRRTKSGKAGLRTEALLSLCAPCLPLFYNDSDWVAYDAQH